MSFFENVEMAPIDPIFGINTAFKNEERTSKINLGVGTFKTEALQPLVLTSVKKAERALLEDNLDKDYLPIEGHPLFLAQTKKLVLGNQNLDNVAIAQTIGGTGALKIGADFLKTLHFKTTHLPLPTWDNHRRIFTHARFEIAHYPYYSSVKKAFDFDEMMHYLRNCQEHQVVLLQASCHNPTGCDPSLDQWRAILEVMRDRHLLPFFDFAYQGFGEGLEQDCKAVKLFLEEGMEFLIALSYSKNFGLYAERIGALLAVSSRSDSAKRVESQIKVIIRGIYSNPACHGSRIVAKILADPQLCAEWKEELQGMQRRITHMRKALIDALNSPRYDFMREQKGMFSYTGLESASVERLAEEFAIYLPKDGRINVAGLNDKNLDYVVKAIKAVEQK